MTTSPRLLSMQDGSMPFKKSFLNNLLLGLKKGGVASRDMGFRERKEAIKHAADAALASSRGCAPCWSRSLAAELAHRRHRFAKEPLSPSDWKPAGKVISKRILRRSLRRRPRKAAAAKPRRATDVLARAMVRKRTRVLKEIVPGGKGLNECTLLGETLDYAMSLRAQVDVMQLLVKVLLAPKPYTEEVLTSN